MKRMRELLIESVSVALGIPLPKYIEDAQTAWIDAQLALSTHVPKPPPPKPAEPKPVEPKSKGRGAKAEITNYVPPPLEVPWVDEELKAKKEALAKASSQLWLKRLYEISKEPTIPRKVGQGMDFGPYGFMFGKAAAASQAAKPKAALDAEDREETATICWYRLRDAMQVFSGYADRSSELRKYENMWDDARLFEQKEQV